MLKKLQGRITKNVLVKNIFILAGGSGVAQMFPFIAAIFISRLYTPAELGIYALYFSLSTIIGTIISLGYESTIYMSKGNILANNAATLCIMISFILSLVATLALMCFPANFYNLVGLNLIIKYLPLLFLSLFFSAISTILTIRFNRQGFFKLLSKIKIITAFCASFIQVFLGYLHMGSFGLILANILAYIVADILFLSYWITSDFFSVSMIRKRNLIYIFHKFKNFSFYMTPTAIISSISGELPNLLLMKFFGDAVVGFYSFGQKVIVFPISFIVNSIQNVFQKEATDEFHQTGSSRSIYLRTFKLMLPFAVVAICGFVLFTPFVFKLLFGIKWMVAARFVQIMTAFIIVRSVSSILSFPIVLVEKQKINLLFLITLIMITGGTYYLGYILFQTATGTLALSSFAGVIFYILYMRYSYNCSKMVVTVKKSFKK